MKRGRNSWAFNTEGKGTKRGKFSHLLFDYSGPSFSDLPADIMVNVLLRLSMKKILVCKIVCKTWHDLISEPEFAKLHLDQAQAYPLIQVSSYQVQSRMLYLVQPEEELFERKLEMCDHSAYKSKCACHVKSFKLNTKFKLPLRNLQMLFDDKYSGPNMVDHVSGDSGSAKTSLPADDKKDYLKRNISRYLSVAGGAGVNVPPLALPVRLNMKDHKYHVVNSCNGLLCLSNPSNNEPLIVCNPVTSEFINLPKVNKGGLDRDIMCCGFGFSPASNQYKVIIIILRWTRAKVHTLGTETWRDIKLFTPGKLGVPTCLNGFLYWPYRGKTLGVRSFDIENECFGWISAPPVNDSVLYMEQVRVGELGGELCISTSTSSVSEVWVLKDSGTRNVWSKVFSIHPDSDRYRPLGYGRCHPIKYLNDGGLLMFHSSTNSLVYTHPRKQIFRYIKIRGTKSNLDVIAHIPSFVSLKDALSGQNVKVLKSRCARLKLLDEGTCISVSESNPQGLWIRF